MATLQAQPPSYYRSRPHHILRETAYPPPMGRKHSSSPGQHREGRHDKPWQHMTQTYTWVAEQELQKLDRRTRKTEEWILEQQIFLVTEGGKDRSVPGRGDKVRRKLWEDLRYAYEEEAERWMRQEEEARRMATEREKMKARIIQEELKRVEAKIRQKREAEKRKIMEERARIHAEMREYDKRDRARMDKAAHDAWGKYESRWSALAGSSEELTFSNIPWPLVSAPKTVEEITPSGIASFLLSPAHLQSQSRKERLRNAQLRWHPDRFRRLMGRVTDEDKKIVEEGVGAIARCLNDLMAQEKTALRSVGVPLRLNDDHSFL